MPARSSGTTLGETIDRCADLNDVASLLSANGDHVAALEAGDILAVGALDDEVAGVGWLRLSQHVDRHYGRWSRPDSGTAYLNQLFVRPDARGHGVAGLLIDDLLLHAGLAGRTAVCSVVDPDNTASLRACRASRRDRYRAALRPSAGPPHHASGAPPRTVRRRSAHPGRC